MDPLPLEPAQDSDDLPAFINPFDAATFTDQYDASGEALSYTCGIKADSSSSCCCRIELFSIDVQTCAHHLHLSVMHAFDMHLASRHGCVYAHIHTRARIQSCSALTETRSHVHAHAHALADTMTCMHRVHTPVPFCNARSKRRSSLQGQDLCVCVCVCVCDATLCSK